MSLQSEDLLEIYRLMKLSRRFTEKGLEWYKTGRILEGLHPSIGQEAVGVGACYGLQPGDWVLPSLRIREAFFTRGVSVAEQLATMCAKATGTSRGKDTSHHAAHPANGILWGTGIVGASIPVAAGAALALKRSQTGNVILCFFGDGAANKGDFHEGINFAAVFKLPVIYVCENNLYGMTVPHSHACSVEDIADRAHSYGIPGVVVDGQDVIAVHEAVQEAVERARRGEGPTLVEAKTYRFLSHFPTLPDDRPLGEIEQWRSRDPIKILQDKLLRERIITQAQVQSLEREIEAEIEEGIHYAERSPDPDPAGALTDVYTPNISTQGG